MARSNGQVRLHGRKDGCTRACYENRRIVWQNCVTPSSADVTEASKYYAPD